MQFTPSNADLPQARANLVCDECEGWIYEGECCAGMRVDGSGNEHATCLQCWFLLTIVVHVMREPQPPRGGLKAALTGLTMHPDGKWTSGALRGAMARRGARTGETIQIMRDKRKPF